MILRHPALFLVALFCSGASGLMYETLWVRLLSFTFGATALATAVVLAAFFTGLGLGGWLAGRIVDRVRAPLYAYAGLEVLILINSLGVYAGLQNLGPVYVTLYRSIFHQSTALVTVAQFVLSFVLILLPSAMMGATLPILARAYRTPERSFGWSLGVLYAVNTAGGVAGLLAIGFFLIELFGIRASYFLTGLLNIAAAILAIAACWHRAARHSPMSATPSEPAMEPNSGAVPSPTMFLLNPWQVYALTFLFGFASIGLQVLWIRLWSYISLHSNNIRVGFAPAEFSSTYVFSGILMIFLLGITVGGWLVRRTLGPGLHPLRTLGMAQLFQGGWVLLTAMGQRFVYTDELWLKLLEIAVVVVPAAVAMGLSFPLLAHLQVRRADTAGSEFGSYYLFNSLGCALGSLTAGLILLPLLGTYRALALFGSATCAIGLVLLWASAAKSVRASQRWRLSLVSLAVVAALSVTIVNSSSVARAIAGEEVLFEEDNEVAHTVVTGEGSERLLIMNNHAQAARSRYETGFGFRTLMIPAALMGHVPTDILLLCVGVGNAWIGAQAYDASVTAVDINPAVFRAMDYMHGPDVTATLQRPNNQPIVGDARNYLFLTDRRFDIINVDPGPPITQPGMVNLHTREFYELVKARLKPDGVMYMRLSRDVENEVFYRMLVRSVAEVFPEVTLWSFGRGGVHIFAADWKFSTVSQNKDLVEPSIFDEMEDWFSMGRPEVERYVANVPAVTDDQPRLEYFLLSRLRGTWPDGTPYELAGPQRNRTALLAGRVPMSKYLARGRTR